MKKYAKNSAWLFLDYSSRFIGGILVSVFLLRFLGPEKYGVFGYAVAFLGTAMPLSILGLQGTLVREIVAADYSKEEVLGTSFLLRMLGATVAFTMMFVYLLLVVDSSDRFWFSLVLLLTIFSQPFSVILLYFESQLEGREVVITKVLSFLVRIIGIGLLVVMKADLICFVIPIVLEALVLLALVVLRYEVLTRNSLFSWRWKKEVATKLLSKSWPLIISGLSAVLYLRLDQIMLTELKGEYEGGLYMAAVRISSVFYLFPAVIVSTFFPLLIKLFESGDESFTEVFRGLLQGMLLLSIGIVLSMQVFGPYLVSVLLGPAYADSIPIFLVHIYSLIFVFAGALLSKWLIVADLTIYSLLRHGLGLLANLALNFLWIPKYGAIGAAYASLFSLACAVVFFNLLSKKTWPFLGHLIYSLSPRYTVKLYKLIRLKVAG